MTTAYLLLNGSLLMVLYCPILKPISSHPIIQAKDYGTSAVQPRLAYGPMLAYAEIHFSALNHPTFSPLVPLPPRQLAAGISATSAFRTCSGTNTGALPRSSNLATVTRFLNVIISSR